MSWQFRRCCDAWRDTWRQTGGSWYKRLAVTLWRLTGGWASGDDLELQEDRAVNHGLEPLVALFALFVVQVVTAVLAERGKGVRTAPMIFYTVVGGLILRFIVCVNRSIRTNEKGRTFYAYDQGTKMLGKWIFFATAVLWGSVTMAGFKGWWPGQQAPTEVPPIRVTRVDKWDPGDGFPGMEAVIPLAQDQFPGEIPEHFYLELRFGPSLGAWEMVDGRLVGVDEQGNPTSSSKALVRIENRSAPGIVEVSDLSPAPSYRLSVMLEPADEAAIEARNGLIAGAKLPDDQLKGLQDQVKKYTDKYLKERHSLRRVLLDTEIHRL